MKCHAKTSRGGRCTRQGWRDSPVCAMHLQVLYGQFLKETLGNGGKVQMFAMKRPDTDVDCYVEAE